MSKVILKPRKPYLISRDKMLKRDIDIGGRDLIIGFNEPGVRSGKGADELFAQLNARLPAYFLPAVDLASMQVHRPQLYIVSGINMAMRWNVTSEEQRLKILAYNKMKFDFLKRFFDTFFPETFSVIEYIVSQDALRISEGNLLEIWNHLEMSYPRRMKKLVERLAHFKHPEWFREGRVTDKLKKFTETHRDELEDSFKYAIAHLFALGDINFDGNYYINPHGFASIGGYQEQFFNEVRNLAFDLLKKYPYLLSGRELLVRDNVQIVINEQVPPPYTGATRGNSRRRELDEVTYENGRGLNYYDTRPRLEPDMSYLYRHVPRQTYEDFWREYRSRYELLKSRYAEAYHVEL